MNEDYEGLTILLLSCLAIVLGLVLANRYLGTETRNEFFHKYKTSEIITK